MFHEQERAGGEPLNHERAEHDGGNDVSGHPEGQERDQRAAAYRVVGGFRCGDALHTALAVHFRRLGKAFGLRIGEEGCRTDARSRDDADERAEERGTQQVELVRPDFPERQPLIGQLALLDDPALAEEDILKGQEHLRYREKPDERGHQRDAVEQFRHIERVAEIAGRDTRIKSVKFM